MSKNFELEYKAYIDDVKPDLWNRIAAGLPERSQITEEDKEVAEIVDFQEKKADSEKIVQMPQKRKWHRYSGIIAACLCVAILVPIYVTNREQMQKDSQANAYGSQSSISNTEASGDVDKVVVGNKEMSIVFESVTGVVESIDGDQITIAIDEASSSLKSDEATITVTIPDDLSVEEKEAYSFHLKKGDDGTYTVLKAEPLQ